MKERKETKMEETHERETDNVMYYNNKSITNQRPLYSVV